MTKKQLDRQNKTLGSIELAGTDSAVLGFYGVNGLDMALRRSDFDVHEEIDTIIRHVRDPDPKVSLSALKQFRSVMKEIVGMNGMIATAQQTVVGDGPVIQTVSTSGLLSDLRKENEYNESRSEQENIAYEIHTASGQKETIPLLRGVSDGGDDDREDG